MRDAEKYINNIEFTNWDDLLEGHRYLHVSKLKELIIKIQKDAYNQAIEDAADNAIADYNIVGNSDFAEDNDIECYVIKNSILKLKIK